MTLFQLMQAVLMLVNGAAIVNNDRFLEKCAHRRAVLFDLRGWGVVRQRSLLCAAARVAMIARSISHPKR